MTQTALLHLPVRERALSVRLASLRASYRCLRIAGKPVRRLVDHPDVVSPAVPPLVNLYLHRVGAFVRSLRLFAECAGAAELAPWVERLRVERSNCQSKVDVCLTAATAVTAEALTACYQDYARLFNSVVDAYQLACDLELSGRPSGTQPDSLRTYAADIGLWERGVTVQVQATDVQQALALAQQEVALARQGGRISDDDEQMVVQMHLLPPGGTNCGAAHCPCQGAAKPRLVYDFINGLYN